MKKLLLMTLILGFIVSISGSEVKIEDYKSGSSAVKLTEQAVYKIPTERIKEYYSIEDFKILYTEYLNLNNIKLLTSAEEDKTKMSKEDQLKYYTISDITPEDVKNEIGCQIFKVNSTCEAYVIYKGELFQIGFGFGGFGVVTIKTCDFDENGQKDIIYTFSWGSGLHRSHIGIYNFTDKKETWLDFVQLNEDITLEKLSEISFNIHTAELKMKEELNYTQYQTSTKIMVAKVSAMDGNIEVIELD